MKLAICVLLALIFKVQADDRPNIVFLLVDDQDVMLNSLDAMQQTREIFSENGLKFVNGFASTPVCCVSRSSILLGRYIHNHIAHNNTDEGNCYSDAWIRVEEPYTYAAYLHNEGYKTFYSGKYLNRYGKGGGGSSRTYETVPVGWDDWYTLCGDAQFYDYTLSNNGQEETHGYRYTQDYFPLLMKNHALEFLDEYGTSSSKDPFLMVLATPAAHKPWTPSPKYSDLLNEPDLRAPRTLSWNNLGENFDNSDKGAVLRSLTEMDENLISQSDLIYRMRHAVLLTVDDMMKEIYEKLAENNQLENTYFIYTADHGFHVGQYGMTFGKRLLYEPDIRVPFYISGPNVKKGGVTSVVALNIDIAPTILDLALGYVPDNMDGKSLIEYFDLSDDEEYELSIQKQSFLIEYNGETPPPEMVAGGEQPPQQHRHLLSNTNDNELIMNCESQVEGLDGMNCDTMNNTYRCVRVIDGLKEISDVSLTADDTDFEVTLQDFVKGEIYCSYTCFTNGFVETDCMEGTIEFLGEYYDLDYDLWQTKNAMLSLSDDEKEEYESLLKKLLSCKGQTQCNHARLQESSMKSSETQTTQRKAKRIVRKSNVNNNEIINEKNNNARIISNSSLLFIGLMIIIGLGFIYYLYNKAAKKFNQKRNKKPKYEKIVTPNYGGINIPDQLL